MMTHSMIDGGDCRTASATPGLLNILQTWPRSYLNAPEVSTHANSFVNRSRKVTEFRTFIWQMAPYGHTFNRHALNSEIISSKPSCSI